MSQQDRPGILVFEGEDVDCTMLYHPVNVSGPFNRDGRMTFTRTRNRPGQGASGYGSKISSDWKIKYGNRLYRVYITQWSNAGTAWICVRGNRIVVR